MTQGKSNPCLRRKVGKEDPTREQQKPRLGVGGHGGRTGADSAVPENIPETAVGTTDRKHTTYLGIFTPNIYTF